MRNLLCLAALGLQLACMKPARPVNVYRLGDKVQAGSFTYNVLEAKWRAEIGEGQTARIPERRFLIIHLSVTNTGSQELSLPALTIADQSGRTFDESMDGSEIPYWIGILRKVKPGGVLDGSILFDVEPKSYKLRLDDDAGPASSMVELPLQFEAGARFSPSPIHPPPRP